MEQRQFLANEDIPRRERELYEIGDSVKYSEYCDENGITPSFKEFYEAGKRYLDKLEELRKPGRLEQKSRQSSSKVNQDVLRSLLGYDRGRKINSNDVFEHTQGKREALEKIMGYQGLRVVGGKFVSLDEASPARIGEVYKKLINQAKRTIKD